MPKDLDNPSEQEIADLSPEIRKYVEERVKPSINHFRKEWRTIRKKEQVLQYLIIVVGALIPLVNVGGFANSPYTNYVSAILGGGIVVSTGILQFQKYHERWLIDKNTKAKLMYEFYCYKYHIGPYESLGPAQDLDTLFVERCEIILLSEATDFVGLFSSVNGGHPASLGRAQDTIPTHTTQRTYVGTEPVSRDAENK